MGKNPRKERKYVDHKDVGKGDKSDNGDTDLSKTETFEKYEREREMTERVMK